MVSLSRAAASALSRGDLTVVAERLTLIESTAADNLREARLIVAELTPGHLQSRSLAAALDRLCAALRQEGGLAVTFEVSGDPTPLGGTVDVLVFRTAQEALANIRRHARATTAAMALDYSDPGLVRLRVGDDGVGFDPEAADGAQGFGLDGLRARVAAASGDVRISSAPGRGTVLLVSIPHDVSAQVHPS